MTPHHKENNTQTYTHAENYTYYINKRGWNQAESVVFALQHTNIYRYMYLYFINCIIYIDTD